MHPPASAASSCGETRGSPESEDSGDSLGRSACCRGERDDRARPGTWIAWDDAGNIRFIFGYAAYDGLKRPGRRAAGGGVQLAWNDRRQYAIETAPRQRPERVKAEIVRRRGFKTIHLLEEMVGEFDYRPTACKKSYRMIVVRKRLATDRGQMRLSRGVSLLLLHRSTTARCRSNT